MLPDFDEINKSWSFRISPYLDTLRARINYRIDELLSQPSSFRYSDPVSQAKKLKGIDLGYFVCVWWPSAPIHTLSTLACYLLWNFIWDEEIDSDSGSLGKDIMAAGRYRETTLTYLRKELGLEELAYNQDKEVITTNVLITSVKHVTQALASKDRRQRERFYEEVEHWINTTEVEQARRRESNLSHFDDYIELRLGTVGLRPCCILYDILAGPIFNSNPPNPFYNSSPALTNFDEDISLMIDQVTLMVAVTNDIFSCKKELADGAPDNAIPVLWLQTQDLRKAVDMATDILRMSKEVFDQTEQKVLGRCADNARETMAVKSYLESLKTNIIGNVAWSMRCKRYGLQDKVGQRVILITL